MKISEFYYDLPKHFIAQEPSGKRQLSRLMILDRETGDIQHRIFKELVEFLNEGDCIVMNNTRVMPARLLGVREDTGGKIEFVLLKKIRNDTWEVILKPGRRAKPGARFVFGNGILRAEILKIVEEGNRIVRFEYEGVFEQILNRVGIIPLPPYITKELKDPERYQTVYSKYKGSAAAPTAGLHFTGELLDSIGEKGINLAYLTLHVGLGTFRPVKVENIKEHKMHSEYFSINKEACEKINTARDNGKRVIAIGTTSCRVLETAGSIQGYVKPQKGWTNIYIYPGYKFKIVDAIVTNFHLPGSTLIILVSAFAGKEKIKTAYEEAKRCKYSFFSFGDAMLIK